MIDVWIWVLEMLCDYGGLLFILGELVDMVGVMFLVVKGLVKLGVVSEEDVFCDMFYFCFDFDLFSKDLLND